eukprot:scaffold426756_cov22-Prasinocladus_malaysianus.AAC.1
MELKSKQLLNGVVALSTNIKGWQSCSAENGQVMTADNIIGELLSRSGHHTVRLVHNALKQFEVPMACIFSTISNFQGEIKGEFTGEQRAEELGSVHRLLLQAGASRHATCCFSEGLEPRGHLLLSPDIGPTSLDKLLSCFAVAIWRGSQIPTRNMYP